MTGSQLATYGGLNDSPQRLPRPNSQTCEYVTVHSKRDFENLIKDLETERSSWIIQVGPMSSQVLIRWRQEVRGGDVVSEGGQVRRRKGGTGGRDATGWTMGAFLESGKGKGRDSVPVPLEGRQPCQHPDSRLLSSRTVRELTS